MVSAIGLRWMGMSGLYGLAAEDEYIPAVRARLAALLVERSLRRLARPLLGRDADRVSWPRGRQQHERFPPRCNGTQLASDLKPVERCWVQASGKRDNWRHDCHRFAIRRAGRGVTP